MDKLRIRFEKTGRAVYISHLDLMKMMQRAFSRAELPLKYSEGFNPHPQISIALPLSVGTGSICELMDFRLAVDTDLSLIPEKLTAVLPEGIRVTAAYEAERKCAEIKWLAVTGIFEYDDLNSTEMTQQLNEFFAKDKIVITKKTKRGIGETDIKPAIRSISFAATESGVLVSAVISAQEPTLNPDLLADALRQLSPELAPDFAKFTRVEIYSSDMKVFR